MTDEGAIVDEVEAFYKDYIEAWNRRDAAQVAQSYDRPYVGLSGDHALSPVTSDEEHDRWYEQVVTGYYDRQGWARTGIDRLQVWPLSSSLVELVADLIRYGKDGSERQRTRATYTLRRGHDGWKVMTYAAVEEPFPGPGLPRRQPGD